MTVLRLAQNERLRRRVVEPGLAALAALLLITAAQAALPGKFQPLASSAHRLPATKPAAAPQAQPAVLISFAQPVAGYPIVSPFGLRQMPWEQQGRLHEGVDIAAPEGQPIAASADGVVTRSGDSPSYGRFVEIQHTAGLTTFYAHMGAIDPAIRSGAAVKAGTRIGVIGNSGSSTGPHLHFEVRDDEDRPLDPQAFLGRSFANADQLPLREAARVSGHVRIAFASRIPDSKRALMEARLDGKTRQSDRIVVADNSGVAVKAGSWMQVRLDEHQRVRAQIRQIAEAQHHETAPAAPSAADAAAPASAVAPIKVAPATLDVAS